MVREAEGKQIDFSKHMKIVCWSSACLPFEALASPAASCLAALDATQGIAVHSVGTSGL